LAAVLQAKNNGVRTAGSEVTFVHLGLHKEGKMFSLASQTLLSIMLPCSVLGRTTRTQRCCVRDQSTFVVWTHSLDHSRQKFTGTNHAANKTVLHHHHHHSKLFS